MTVIYGLKKWKSEAIGQAERAWVEMHSFLIIEQHIIEYLLYIGPSQCTDYTAVVVTALMLLN